MSASAPPQHSRVPSLAAPLTASLPAGGRGEAEEIRRAPGGKVVTLGPQQHSTDVARGGGPDSVAQVGYCLQTEQIPRRPTRNRSGTGPSCNPKVTRSALPCGCGGTSSSSSIGAHSWCSDANASSISDWTVVTLMRRQSAARWVRYSSSAVLPTPLRRGSPGNGSHAGGAPRGGNQFAVNGGCA